MTTAREAYSEDDNFLIGDDFITNRFRREARQLHLSEFPRTRREAHFARYRNSFLKCDLDQTNSRIEQGRKLRLAELERARAAVLKEDEKRRGNRRDIPMSSPKSANESGKMSKVDTKSKGSLSGRRVTKEFQQDSCPKISLRSSSRVSLLLSRWQNWRIPIMIERVQEIRIQDIANQRKMEKIQLGMKVQVQIGVNRKSNSPIHA